MLDFIISLAAFIIRQKRFPNITSPKSLTDKIFVIKLKQNSSIANLRCLSADRLAVREYISSKSNQCELINVLWRGKLISKKTWNELPEKFVIKANHGSKMVRIVNKNVDDFDAINNLTRVWLDKDYYSKGREWVYKNTPRELLVEEFLKFDDDVPPDFKFFCLNGKVGFVQVDLDRFNGHTRNLYTRDFHLLDVKYHFNRGYDIEKPCSFDKAVMIAEELSMDFDFIRVDLYIIGDKVYFGELTNFPGNCLESFDDYKFNLSMGNKLVLNNDQ